MLRLRLASAFGAACASLLPAVAAASPERAISEYHPAPGCPGEFTFRAQVQARTEAVELAPAEEPWPNGADVRFVVWLQQLRDGYAGTLEIVRDGVTTSSRLEAKSCDEVVAGLSIAAALSSDSVSASKPRLTLPTAPKPASPPPGLAPPAPAVPAASVKPSTRAWLLGATFGERFGYAPRGSLAAGLLFGRTGFSGGASPVLRGAVNMTFANDVASNGSPPLNVGFTWLGGSGDVCPLSLRAGPSAALFPCLSLELGGLRATATDGGTSLRPWVAPGLALRFTAAFGGLFVEPALVARFPLLRDRYWFRPDTLAFRVPALTVEAALAGGIAF